MSRSSGKACVSTNLLENEISLERTRSAAATSEAGLASEATPQRRSVEEVLREADAGALEVSAPQEEVSALWERRRQRSELLARAGERREKCEGIGQFNAKNN
jgi:hypothetical protein